MGMNLDQRRVWLIAPGEGEKLWSDWEKNEEIALGFGANFGDASDLLDEVLIKERLKETTGKNNPFNDARAIHDFAHKCRRRRRLAESWRKDNLGIGEIARLCLILLERVSTQRGRLNQNRAMDVMTQDLLRR